ncbi:hypothetical protein FRC09_000051 [Ceratobasidium sp. 395]|nr:hypothetical protein FRC09_000051 [Ceratobasidium sp. 395]
MPAQVIDAASNINSGATSSLPLSGIPALVSVPMSPFHILAMMPRLFDSIETQRKQAVMGLNEYHFICAFPGLEAQIMGVSVLRELGLPNPFVPPLRVKSPGRDTKDACLVHN